MGCPDITGSFRMCNLVWKLIPFILKSRLEGSKGCRPYTFLCIALLWLVALQLYLLFL